MITSINSLCVSFPPWAPGPHQGLVGEFPSIDLGDFNLQSLGVESEVDWDFMETMTCMDLIQVIQGLTRNSGHTLDLVFLLEQCLCDLELVDLSFEPLSWSDNSLVTMSLRAISPCREAGPIKLVYPQQLMDPDGSQKELGIIADLLHSLIDLLVTV